MGSSSVLPFPLYFPSKIRFLCHYKFKFSSYPILIRPKNPRPSSVSASIAQKDLEFSWVPSDPSVPDVYNGWAVVEAPAVQKRKKKGATLVMISVGASVAALLGVIAYISLSNKGFQCRFTGRINALQGILLPPKTEEKSIGNEAVNLDASKENTDVSEGKHEGLSHTVDVIVEIESKHHITRQGDLWRIIVPIAMDSTQQEAVSVLKKLKIIEDDVIVDSFCTRREYARWLVRANLQLERSRKHQIVPSAALSGSRVAAFDDVSAEDPDFGYIQSLAEAGIIPSKLLNGNFASDLNNSKGRDSCSFFPERFMSRQDLISWKAKLEYGLMPGIDEEISRKKIGFLDAREISSEALMDLFMDILADKRSILRRVFGRSKRFQPRKPSTKAQAAVALTSGRMTELISAELSRLEAEDVSRQIAMQEIRSELLKRGDIQKYWDRKMEGERSRGLEVERDYLAAVNDLEQEKTVQETVEAEILKQKAALDCQKQLLSSLKEEVNEMSERLSLERAQYVEERSNLEAVLCDLQAKQEGLVDAKSVLEAEIEALRILRSWVEDEARKSQARAKVLEEVERRWKWYKQS